jgi:hypothetical protein
VSEVKAPAPGRIWGYAATLAWTVLAIFLGQMVALTVAMVWRPEGVSALITSYDGALITQFIVISNVVTIAVLALAVRLSRSNLADYLALKWPARRDVVVGIVCLVALIVISDGVLYLAGQPLVTPFQAESYASARTEGWLPGLLVAAVIIAPAGEEVVFRGFLFGGWARSQRAAWPAIILISLLWAALHVQYDWIGIAQIFVTGLFLGFIRWRAASTLLTFVLHALFNLEGMVETMVHAKFF